MGSVWEVFSVMLRLGTMAFGGPVAHLAHFERELIEKREWLEGEDFADLVAFCQFLPGPASSQVGMGLGLMRAGIFGMFAAWFAFSLPSVLLLLGAAAGLHALSGGETEWIHGLMAGVVAIVFDAIVKMGRKLCLTRRHLSLAIASTIALVSVPGVFAQLAVILLGGLSGLWLLPAPAPRKATGAAPRMGRTTLFVGWGILCALVLLPIAVSPLADPRDLSLLNVYTSFARTGSLVFGGGHVVLPMLQVEVVGPGWMSAEEFLAGYGITQAMPGPIFTLSSFLGATIGAYVAPGAFTFLLFASAALLGIFMPSFGFMAALFPLWHRMRASDTARRALSGINAAVVGLLGAALYDPVWTKAMDTSDSRLSVCLVLLSWGLLVVWKRPAWQVVGVSALGGVAFGL